MKKPNQCESPQYPLVSGVSLLGAALHQSPESVCVLLTTWCIIDKLYFYSFIMVNSLE